MKNKIGLVIGFIAGFAGFLLLFKVIILDKTSSSDELAPDIVMMMAAVSGVLFAFIGSSLQYYFARKKSYKS